LRAAIAGTLSHGPQAEAAAYQCADHHFGAAPVVLGIDIDKAPIRRIFCTDPQGLSCAAERDWEIDRLLALGARRVDIEQTGGESWTVLADPEGNEFCVVRPKETLIR
jgi:Glyoxalase-like domain